jgi:hypothetical protein
MDINFCVILRLVSNMSTKLMDKMQQGKVVANKRYLSDCMLSWKEYCILVKYV